MASKRSHRGRRAGPPRFFYFPWEEKDRRVRRERELAREAKRWDEDRIRRFEEDQRRKPSGSHLPKSPSGIRT
jgi:hypothetical protein